MILDLSKIEEISTEELEKAMAVIKDEIARRKELTATYEVSYHRYKGSGKAWIAELDPATKARIRFLEPSFLRKTDSQEVTKFYELPPGMYETNSYLSKAYDVRKIIVVDENGKIETISRKEVRVCVKKTVSANS